MELTDINFLKQNKSTFLFGIHRNSRQNDKKKFTIVRALKVKCSLDMQTHAAHYQLILHLNEFRVLIVVIGNRLFKFNSISVSNSHIKWNFN